MSESKLSLTKPSVLLPQRPSVSGGVEDQQPAVQDGQREEGHEEVWTHREKSLVDREDTHGLDLFLSKG